MPLACTSFHLTVFPDPRMPDLMASTIPDSNATPDADRSNGQPEDGVSPETVEQEGRLDGQSGVDPEAYSNAVGHRIAFDRLRERVRAIRERIADIDSTIDQIQSVQRDGAAAETQTNILLAKAQDLDTRRSDIETSVEAVEQEQLAKTKRGSLLYATLYSVAGIFFIAGDVIMSREIVANALKLPGSVEPWIFAIGLAMLAILVKPAYDRLVEERYWQGESGWFAGTIAVCSVGALSTLWILGAFRSTAFVSNTKIQRLTSELLRTEDPAQIAQIEAQVGTLQQSLIESPLGYWAFVLSGVLFALAGAVCLGIGFRHIRDAYHIRWSLYKTRSRLQGEYAEVNEALQTVRDDIERNRIEQSRARQVLNDLPPLKHLRERRDELLDTEQTLLDDQAEARVDHLEAVYRRAHAQGESGIAPLPPASNRSTHERSSGSDAIPAADASDVSVHANRTSARNPSTGPPPNGTRPTDAPDDTSLRPHQALREIVRRHR